MSDSARLARYRTLLGRRGARSAADLCAQLEISRATLKRDLARLRDRHGMPIRYDRERGGYVLDGTDTDLELPGLWFRADELQALLTLRHLLAGIEPGGLLEAHLGPLQRRLEQALGAAGRNSAAIERHVRVIALAARRLDPEPFSTVGHALLDRRRLCIDYFNRSRGEHNTREVSPQRLIHYRDNWYLDAWCHWRDGLRTFSVDAIKLARVLDPAAIDVPDAELDTVLGAGYGIFSGAAVQWATLRFSPERSRWVSAERWHPQQRGGWDEDGCWLLEVPYADPRELVMDILRHVPEVQVIGPPVLREVVLEKLKAGLERLRN